MGQMVRDFCDFCDKTLGRSLRVYVSYEDYSGSAFGRSVGRREYCGEACAVADREKREEELRGRWRSM